MKKNVITYVPNQVSSVVELFNKHLKNRYKELNEDNSEELFEIFIQQDVYANLKDPQKYFNDYIAFMQQWNMPYSFYPYYTYFNKVLPDKVAKPNPRVELTVKDIGTYNIVNQICHGCIFLNVNKLKSIDFTFNRDYPILYFLQDLVEQCYVKKLWISNCWYLDILHSWEYFKTVTKEGFNIDTKKFQEEKAKYQQLKIEYHPVQVFIDNLKKWNN